MEESKLAITTKDSTGEAEPRVSVNARLPKSLDVALEIAVAKAGGTKQQLIENALRAYLGESAAA